MWQDVSLASQAGKFSYYAGAYILTSLAMTVLSIPYMALLPEMANSYDERTSFNTYRSAASVIGTFAAVAMKPLAEACGGGSAGWASRGGVGRNLADAAVDRGLQGQFRTAGVQPLRVAHVSRGSAFDRGPYVNYRTLAAFFILARIAVDMIGAMFLFYFVDFLDREGDFETTMFLFLSLAVLSLPILAARSEAARQADHLRRRGVVVDRRPVLHLRGPTRLAALDDVRNRLAGRDRLRGRRPDALVDARRRHRRRRTRLRRAPRRRLRGVLHLPAQARRRVRRAADRIRARPRGLLGRGRFRAGRAMSRSRRFAC